MKGIYQKKFQSPSLYKVSALVLPIVSASGRLDDWVEGGLPKFCNSRGSLGAIIMIRDFTGSNSRGSLGAIIMIRDFTGSRVKGYSHNRSKRGNRREG